MKKKNPTISITAAKDLLLAGKWRHLRNMVIKAQVIYKTDDAIIIIIPAESPLIINSKFDPTIWEELRTIDIASEEDTKKIINKDHFINGILCGIWQANEDLIGALDNLELPEYIITYKCYCKDLSDMILSAFGEEGDLPKRIINVIESSNEPDLIVEKRYQVLRTMLWNHYGTEVYGAISRDEINTDNKHISDLLHRISNLSSLFNDLADSRMSFVTENHPEDEEEYSVWINDIEAKDYRYSEIPELKVLHDCDTMLNAHNILLDSITDLTETLATSILSGDFPEYMQSYAKVYLAALEGTRTGEYSKLPAILGNTFIATEVTDDGAWLKIRLAKLGFTLQRMVVDYFDWDGSWVVPATNLIQE